MASNLTVSQGPITAQSAASAEPSPVDVIETSAMKGEWTTPAVEKVSLALALSNFSAKWRGSRGLRSEDVSAGTVAICEFNQARQLDMRDAADFGIVMLPNKALEQVAQKRRSILPELQTHEVLQDSTLRRLIEILLGEKRAGFSSGLLFLDSVTASLASYLLRHYSVASAAQKDFTGGLAPSVLRRSLEFIEAHLEDNFRLNDLAKEARMSASHLIRSFRQSTGKTPYQYLLHQRIARARSLMHDLRAPLTEVALASGFADQHHLARVFRRVTGLTPSSYRRSL